MSEEKLVFAYWKIRGLAAPIRMLLQYLDVDYENKVYEVSDGPEFDRSCWYDVKHSLSLDFPNLPYLIDGALRLTESRAIIRHVARSHAPLTLLGDGLVEQAHVDMLLNVANDLSRSITNIAYKSKEEYERLLVNHKAKVLPRFLGDLNRFLGDENAFFVGNHVTVADFPLFELIQQSKLMAPDCLADYANLRRFLEKFAQLPKIKQYLESEVAKYPCNNKNAGFK